MFPPVLENYSQHDDFPSTDISRFSGDLGLALLWIVQAALIRSLTRDSLLTPETVTILTSIMHDEGSASIVALAHSEDPRKPVTIREDEGRLLVNGTKKYITGGLQCDFILLTSRHDGEEKPSLFACLPVRILPGGSLAELDIGALKTTSHARLVLSDFNLPRELLLPVEGALMRKLILKWGIIERALILESYIALCLFVCEELDGFDSFDRSVPDGLRRLLAEQKKISRVQLAQAQSGKMVDRKSADTAALVSHIRQIKNYLSLRRTDIPAHLTDRQRDLDLFSIFKM